MRKSEFQTEKKGIPLIVSEDEGERRRVEAAATCMDPLKFTDEAESNMSCAELSRFRLPTIDTEPDHFTPTTTSGQSLLKFDKSGPEDRRT